MGTLNMNSFNFGDFFFMIVHLFDATRKKKPVELRWLQGETNATKRGRRTNNKIVHKIFKELTNFLCLHN